MRKFLLTLAVLCGTVSAWAQVFVPSQSQTIEPEKYYTLRCKATDHVGYLGDVSGVLNGRADKPSIFIFENASEGKYYFKSVASDKYVNIDGSNITLDDEKKTEWTVTYQFDAFSISPSDKNYLNNNGGTNNIKINNHNNGLSASNACSLWQISEELSITEDNTTTWYMIKNVRKNKYATYNGSTSTMTQRADANPAALFYFTKGSVEGTVNIHNYFAGEKKCASYNSWTEKGTDWYLIQQGTALAISNSSDCSGNATSWNDARGEGQLVEFWNGSDPGSAWIIEKFTGNVEDLELSISNSDTKTLYNIKNHRSGKYVDYVGSGTAFKQESGIKYGSYWYFVDAKSELPENIEIPANTKVCRIYNAANTLAVENPSSGNMSENEGVTYPAKIYFLRPFENSGRFGYAIYPYNENEAGWNDLNKTSVCNWNFDDEGSIWTILLADKTTNQLIQEATTVKNDALALIAAAEEADFYTYPAEAIAIAKPAIESINVSTLETSVNSLIVATSALNTLKETEKSTTAPAVGQYIQLKNRNYKTYLKDNGVGLNGVNDATDNTTLWLVVAGEETKVKLQNVATGKYIGEIRQSQDVAMVNESDAKLFAFTNPTDVYGAFHETTGEDYAYGHIAGGNKLVGWEKNAAASQWIISEITLDESLAELQAIYDVVDNAFGDQPGQYKQSMQEIDETMYTTIENVVKPMLEPEATVDVPTAKTIAATLKAKWDGIKTTVREINAPVQGKFYRLKNVASGNYMCGNANDVKLLANGVSVHTTIFYLDENNTLLSYNSGRYLDCYAKGYSAVGDAKSGEFAMAYNGAQANVITYKNNGYSTYGAGADGGNLDRGSSTPNHAGYNWTLEEVTWLPVPMNTDLGYATIYSPVELELSYERVKAFTAEINQAGTAITLTGQNVVPANTGVVLQYQDGAQTDNGCVYLKIKETTLTNVKSQLCGTLADSYVDGDGYILAKPGENATGFYKAAKNYENGTKFLNNGFKAYLPAPVSGARFYVFDFGTETGIDELKGENGNVKSEVYDLAGRRVQNVQKGLYIVNGKKVIK